MLAEDLLWICEQVDVDIDDPLSKSVFLELRETSGVHRSSTD